MDTLHDEVATYMFYFYQGDFIGEHIQWDANNHLLNSAIGHVLYKLFGDHFAILRLPNLLAFVLYFWATVRLTELLSDKWLKISGLIALNSIPFMMEYFGNARGYGLSLGFFAWALVYAYKYFQAYSLQSLIIAYLFLLLAVSANLTMIITSGMMAACFFLYPLLNKPAGRSAWKELLVHAAFGLALIPFFLYGLALKEAGALYYGSLDGIWDVTGKTLSRYALFYDADWLRFAWLGLFALMLIGGILWLRKTAFREWLKQPVVLYALLFFGNLIAAVGMAKLMEVNYPEDRTAMYLIPLFLLIVLHLMDHFVRLRPLQILFLYFPVTFVLHMSLSTSVFSPDDRLDPEFYAAVKKEIGPENSIMIYHIMNWNWPYHESHSDTKASVALFDNPNTTLADILVTKTTVHTNPDIPKLYDTIAYHPPSTYIAFKRKEPVKRIPLDTLTGNPATGNLEYAGICEFSLEPYVGKDLLLDVSGRLKTVAPQNKIQLVVQTFLEDGSQARYLYYSFETTYQGQLIDDNFLHHFIVEGVEPNEKQIKVYLWNRALHLMEVGASKCTIFELKSPEHGT